MHVHLNVLYMYTVRVYLYLHHSGSYCIHVSCLMGDLNFSYIKAFLLFADKGVAVH